MRFTYEMKGEMYIYKGPRGHSGIAYSLEKINDMLTRSYGAGGYSLEQVRTKASPLPIQ